VLIFRLYIVLLCFYVKSGDSGRWILACVGQSNVDHSCKVVLMPWIDSSVSSQRWSRRGSCLSSLFPYARHCPLLPYTTILRCAPSLLKCQCI